MIRAVILDLDDTLLDHRSASRLALGPLADSLKIDSAALAVIWRKIEDSYPPSPDRMTMTETRHARMRALAVCAGASWSIDREQQESAGYLERYAQHWRLFDDVTTTLTKIRSADKRVGILTNGANDLQTAKVRATGLEHLVDVVVISEAIGAAKPAAEAFTTVCAQLQASPGECLYLGDDFLTDVVAARHAGLRAELVLRDIDGEHALENLLRIEGLA